MAYDLDLKYLTNCPGLLKKSLICSIEAELANQSIDNHSGHVSKGTSG